MIGLRDFRPDLRHRIPARTAAAAGCAAFLLLCAGCTNGSSAHTTPAAGTRTGTAGPSVPAQMICAQEAQADIAKVLGLRPSGTPIPTWSDNLYSCRYTFAAGVMVLSVKDLRNGIDATAYYTSLRDSLTSTVTVPKLGQAAFAAPNGSTFVRKDFNVLHIDVSGLPERFGEPPSARGDLAVKVATTIMKCWTEG